MICTVCRARIMCNDSYCEDNVVYRRYKCYKCGKKYYTKEEFEDKDIVNYHLSGRYEHYKEIKNNG